MTERLPFVCPVCRRTSHNPNDEREGYCGACHDWTVFRPGERVSATVNGQTFEAVLRIASPNGRSLMLSFDRAVWLVDGMYAGMMPVLQDDDGVYRELVDGTEVKIERYATPDPRGSGGPKM
jgi:hypothetical protein